MTDQKNIQLLQKGSAATEEQVNQFTECKQRRGEHLFYAGISETGHLIMHYQTSGGYFLVGYWNRQGLLLCKQYYLDYDIDQGVPREYVKTIFFNQINPSHGT